VVARWAPAVAAKLESTQEAGAARVAR
jgi:hypothetical protein